MIACCALAFSITNLKLENLKETLNLLLLSQSQTSNLKTLKKTLNLLLLSQSQTSNLKTLKKNPKSPQCGRFSNSLQSSFHSKNLWLFSMGVQRQT
jgi:hypothetical protein